MAYSPFIAQMIFGILEKRDATYDDLLLSCHSLFPTELIEILRLMENDGEILRIGNSYTMQNSRRRRWERTRDDWDDNAERASRSLATLMNDIHLPHCLDYEWWFNQMSRDYLVRKIFRDSPLPTPKTMVFLASPILGAYASYFVPETRIIIMDRSISTLQKIEQHVRANNIEIYEYNVEEPIPNNLVGCADAVFFDPPWYVEYYDALFTRSATISAETTSVVYSIMFPLLTRPNALIERRNVLEKAMKYGYSLYSLEPKATQYLTPHFERMALKKAGIESKNWRRADLATFISEGNMANCNTHIQLETSKWKEISYDKVKIKIKIIDDEGNIDYRRPKIIKPYGDDEVISTVSRRDPKRSEINVWTSNNHGYAIEGWKATHEIMSLLCNGVKKGEVVEYMVHRYGISSKIATEDVEIIADFLEKLI